MKLLFDENLSPKLPRLLAAQFPGSLHLRNCGLKGATDEEIWGYAAANDFTIVSKDSDFYQRSLFYGSPPKFAWLRIGTARAMTWCGCSRPTNKRFSPSKLSHWNPFWFYREFHTAPRCGWLAAA